MEGLAGLAVVLLLIIVGASLFQAIKVGVVAGAAVAAIVCILWFVLFWLPNRTSGRLTNGVANEDSMSSSKKPRFSDEAIQRAGSILVIGTFITVTIIMFFFNIYKFGK